MKDTCVMRLKEAADALGVCVGTVRNWVDRGRLPALRLPGGERRPLTAGVQAMLRQMVRQVDISNRKADTDAKPRA